MTNAERQRKFRAQRGKIDAEDILQEAYADIFAGITSFSPAGQDAFYHWAVQIINNRFIDHVRFLRRKKRDATREIGQAAAANSMYQSILDQCAGSCERPSMALRREDAQRAIMTGLCRLPADYREAVQALFLRQEPLAEVAAKLGRSEDAERRLAGRALEQLRDHLGRASLYLSSSH